MTSPRAGVPWTLGDLRSTFLTTTLGLSMLLVAWWGSSGTGELDRQVTWSAVAIAAVIGIGLGNFFWLLAGRRAVALRQAELVERLEAAFGSAVAASGPDPAEEPTAATLVVVPGTRRFHRSACLLVQGKAGAGPAGNGPPSDLRPCEMCLP